MSINKVLNRPMFRHQALRKGHIKVIKAQTGDFVGPARPMGPCQPTVPSTSVVRPGFMRRGINAMGAVARSPIGKGIGATLSLPGYVGFEATGQVANAMGMKDSPYKLPLQVAGAYGATKLPGAAALAGLGMGPQLGIAALGGAGYFAYLKAKEQQAKIAAMTPKEREEFYAQQRSKALEGEASLDNFDDTFFITNAGKEAMKKTREDAKVIDSSKKTQQRKLRREGKVVTTEEDNLTLKENESDGKVDINKVVDNEKKKMIDKQPDGADPNSVAPVPPVNTQVVESTDKKDNLLSTQEKTEGAAGSTGLTDEGEVGGKKYSSEVITRGKLIAKELLEGRQSQAGLLFLANLASGLLSGKTTQGGIAGAMDVLGQALGPAANNYSIMKLKENELENQIMGQALDIALAEYKLANTNEVTKGQLGRVQYIGPGGKVRNFDGGINENGIPYLLIGGRQVAASDLTGDQLAEFYNDPSLKEFNYAQAIIKDKISDDEAKAHRLLLQNIKSKNIVFDVKGIIKATGAAGTKGNLQIALTKLNSLLNDFGLGSTKDAIARLDSNEEQFFRNLELGYNSGEINEKQYKQLKKAFKKKDMQKIIQNAAEENYKVVDQSTGKLRKPTTNELFELVNAQTTLAYALANSFKDTDRLTQKDVTAAMSVINILPAFGGAETAIASLNALEKDLDRSIDSTINRLERTYFTNAQVMDGFMSLLKGGAGFGKTDSSRVVSPEERMNILQGIQF
jgi:hypothetical protein